MKKKKKKAKKISRKNWKSSYKKWQEIVKKTKKRERFISAQGFPGLLVVKECGYCDEFLSMDYMNSCYVCPLFKKKVCHSNVYDGKNTLFWRYVKEMQKMFIDINWNKALSLAIKIKDAIKKDKPKNK